MKMDTLVFYFFPRIGVIHHILKLFDGFLLFRRNQCRIPQSDNGTTFFNQRLVEDFTITSCKQTKFQQRSRESIKKIPATIQNYLNMFQFLTMINE